MLPSPCAAGRPGTPAAPMDRPALLPAPRGPQVFVPRLSNHASEVVRRCATVAALRRQPSTADHAATSRAAQLYELDREGAYTASPSAPAPAAGPSDSTGVTGRGGGGSDFLDDGWGVVAVGAPPAAPDSKAAIAKRDKRKQKKQLAAQQQVARQAEPQNRRARAVAATPFVDKSSEEGMAGLAMLQLKLVQEGRVAHDEGQKARVAAEGAARRERLARTVRRKRDWVDPELLDVGEGEAEEMSLAAPQQYFEFNLEADGSTEVVEFDSQGREVVRRAPGARPPAPALPASAAAAASTPAAAAKGRGGGASAAQSNDDDDDPLAFLADLDEGEAPGGDEDDADDEDDAVRRRQRVASGSAAGPSRREAQTRGARPAAAAAAGSDGDSDDDEEGAGVSGRRVVMPGEDPLADEDIEWGLEELHPEGRRPSLMRELGVIKGPKSKPKPKKGAGASGSGGGEAGDGAAAAGGRGKQGAAAPAAAAAAGAAAGDDGGGFEGDEGEYDEEREVGVAWGGSGGASGIDMEQQEALLSRLFKPHKVRELMAHQRAAEAELAALKKKTSGRQVLESKVHSRMRIIAGSAAGRQLASSKGATTRPMMEKVRQAIFNMIQAQAGSGGGLPTSARWLDVFAGTGSVGLEALSRGCRECHFIELDPWVCRKVLSKNIASCGFQRQAVVHTMKAEDFLRRSIELPRFAGGAFDFLSICPPYLVVSYPELMDLLNRSPLLHDRSIVFVEYPKQLAHEVPPTLGSLVTVRDRKYGRTWIRVYGPADGPAAGSETEEEDVGDGAEDEGDELLI